MDNKLSELSKPVAWEVKGILCHSEEEARIYVGEPDPLYSQEYVSALLAELEAKDKRIAELEDAEQKLCAANVTLDARASVAEAKLATPVRLPRPACTYADHSYPAYSRKQVEEILSYAGMCFTVEGDE
ncbi:hypothetical protein I5N59_00175 [Serratia marcescens]|uniref:hypothetical protein n=1 Tax=Serratia marcescens TaxID=615 RepID=UPI0018D86C87|nr:hypothetical protein [Serratia marcescens]